jgi:hypothetical protein
MSKVSGMAGSLHGRCNSREPALSRAMFYMGFSPSETSDSFIAPWNEISLSKVYFSVSYSINHHPEQFLLT